MMSERAPAAAPATSARVRMAANAYILNGCDSRLENERFIASSAFFDNFCSGASPRQAAGGFSHYELFTTSAVAPRQQPWPPSPTMYAGSEALPTAAVPPATAINSCDELRYCSRVVNDLRPSAGVQMVHSKSAQRMTHVGTDRDEYAEPHNTTRQRRFKHSNGHCVRASDDSAIADIYSCNTYCSEALRKPSQFPLPAATNTGRRQFARRNGVINSSNKPVEATLSSPPTSTHSSPPLEHHESMASELLMRRSFNAHRKSDLHQLLHLPNSSTTPTTPSVPNPPPSQLTASALAVSPQNHLAPQRPLRRCRSASPAPIRTPLLTAEQQNLIRKSWQRVSKTSVGRSIVQYISEKCKDINALFRDDIAGISRHERYFVDLIQSAIDNLDDMDSALREWLETIGDGHCGFAIKSEHWDAFGEAMTCVLTNWVGPGKAHRETVRAWRILFSYMSDRLGASSRKCSSSGFSNGVDSSGGSTPSSISTSCCNIPRIQLLTLISNGPTTPP